MEHEAIEQSLQPMSKYLSLNGVLKDQGRDRRFNHLNLKRKKEYTELTRQILLGKKLSILSDF